MIKIVFDRLMSYIFPKRCDICGEVVALDETRCEVCSLAKAITKERCYDCGSEKSLCDCKKHRHKNDYEKIIAPFYYDATLVGAVHRLKFGHRPELAVGMASEMVECIKREYKDVSFDAVTYVPLTDKRYKARGYNQSQLLASHISNALDIPLEDTLYRELEDNPLRGKSARHRKADIFGAFDVNKDVNPENKTYLLVDDVKTTGATLNECAATLDIYGAKATYCVTFAVR